MKRRLFLISLAIAACTALVLFVVLPIVSPELPGTIDPAFPNAGTTGVPAGTALTRSGSLDVKQRGTVIDGLDIDGCVDVKADDVTIRRSRITCARPTTAVRLFDGYHNLTLEDVEIDGSGRVSAAVGFSDYTLVRVNIHDVSDGPRMGENTMIRDSYIHDLARREGSHNDAIQVSGGSNIQILHNRLDVYAAATGDFFNAAIMVGTQSARVEDMLIEGNYLDGGNYTVNFRADLTARDVVARDNVFGPHHRYGFLARGNLPGVEWSTLPDLPE
jgi:hypothetical protein